MKTLLLMLKWKQAESHMLAEQAKKRQGTRTDLDIKAKLPECKQGQARDHAAALVGASGRNVSYAKMIAKENPELAEQAKKRQATSTGGANPQLRAKMPQAGKGQARDQSAALVGRQFSPKP